MLACPPQDDGAVIDAAKSARDGGERYLATFTKRASGRSHKCKPDIEEAILLRLLALVDAVAGLSLSHFHRVKSTNNESYFCLDRSTTALLSSRLPPFPRFSCKIRGEVIPLSS